MIMINKAILKKKIQRIESKNNRSEEYIDKIVDITIQECIPELETNLMEWAEDKPYSDVVIGNGWTVNKILEMYPWVSFQEIMSALKIYKAVNFKNDMFTTLFYKL